ncbi:MAG: DUF2268 domain-containing protein [Chitinophagaceae bacterium]|jgi:hypothetical protein|nr:DUF2268 domain-containing protein [Chitinophagaceae bacterium]
MRNLFFLFVTFLCSQSIAQTKIYTSDIDNFWKAYNQVQKITDTVQQLKIIQTTYFDNASQGLKDFIKASEINARWMLKSIKRYPKFWASVMPKTLAVKKQYPELEKIIARYKKLYSKFKQPDICFAIGCLSMGGTTNKNEILIGAEIAAADSLVDASEVGEWLSGVFKNNKGIEFLVAHEMTHTQQPDGDSENDGKSNLLGYCIVEGAADFIAELLLQKPVTSPYMTYGKAHEKTLWEKFKNDMYGQNSDDWLYNGGNDSTKCADLGYFEGYAICKAYYENAKNKEKAIADIIELDRKNLNTLNDFLAKSKYADKWK